MRCRIHRQLARCPSDDQSELWMSFFKDPDGTNLVVMTEKVRS